MTALEDLQDGERARLLDVLTGLDDAGWDTPSLCASWSVRDLVAHLLMPYELSVPAFLTRMVAARGRFDTLADRWARADRRTPADLVRALRDTAGRPFRVPGAPAEAALTHLVTHAEDVYRPLDVDAAVDPRAATTVLDQLAGPRGRRALAPGVVDDVTLVATDVGWTSGTGPRVEGDARSLITVLAGRSAAGADLRGPGADLVRQRLDPSGPAGRRRPADR